RYLQKLWRPVQHIYMILIVMLGWVLFRAENLPQAVNYMKTMFNPLHHPSGAFSIEQFVDNEFILILLVAVTGVTPILTLFANRVQDKVLESSSLVARFSLSSITIVFLLSMFLYSIMSLATSTYNPFIY